MTPRKSLPAVYEAPSAILARVENMTGVPVHLLMCPTRIPEIAQARQLAMAAARIVGLSYPAIGRLLARDHTTVIYGCRKVFADPALTAIARRIANV